ncbi:MAG: hypothetical protein JNM24_17935 [Bdellovibrionaceae bacterium]|nr:hypothetical protein [Pseudobdellovibrionaceae bacterium]
MKFLFLITALLFSANSLAEESQDLSKMLVESHCVPVRGSDGNVSGHKCDGPLGEKIKEGKFQNLEIQKSQKMEIYSQLKKTSKTEVQVQSVKMTMALSLNGKILSRPEIITQLNSLASISQKSDSSPKELLIEVLPSLQKTNNQESILMKFKVGHKENGQIKWFSSPQILAKNNQEAEITVHSNNSNDEYKNISLKVLPALQ